MKNILALALLWSFSLFGAESAGLPEGINLYHLDSNFFEKKNFFEQLLAASFQPGAKTGCDLTNCLELDAYRQRVLGLIEKYVDVLFLTEKEAVLLTGLSCKEGAARYLKNFCPCVVILEKEKGLWVCSSRESLLPTSSFCEDLYQQVFQKAFLIGYSKNYSIKKCLFLADQALITAQKLHD